ARIDLAGLEPDEVARLAVAAAGDAALSDAALGAIVARAAGNPLFARELVGASAEQGAEEALPERLEVLLASRIDRLDAGGRSLLRRAAVLGRSVDFDVLAEALAEDGDDVRDPARWAALDEFVAWDGPSRLHFRHDLIRDAAYEGLSHSRRVELHGRLATVMERRAGDDTDAVAAVLAVHFAQGQMPLPAFRYARQAGDRARLNYANVDAAALYRRALESASGSDEIEDRAVGEVAEALGDVAELAGRYEESAGAYARARTVVRVAPGGAGQLAESNLDLGRIARKTGVVSERVGRYDQALGWYTRGRRLLGTAARTSASDPAGEALRIRLALDVAGIRYRQGHYAACVSEALPAAEAAREAGERALLANAYYLLHAAYGDLGSPEVARFRDLALPIYEELGDLVGQGNVLNNLGIEAYFEGRWDDALALYGRSKEAKERAGDVANAATQSNNEAEILSDQGHLEEAEALLANTLRVWRAAGYEIGIALATSNLGRAAARAGRHEAGLALLEDAAARFGRIGAQGYVDEARARISEALLLAGQPAEAEPVAREALIRVRREASASVLGAQLERTLGWAALQLRDPQRARAHFESSLAESRGLDAQFEIALTLRALAALAGGDDARRNPAGAESETILARLGVVAVADPPAASGAARRSPLVSPMAPEPTVLHHD
ncbi:MAG: ATP-binding protein, partial [Candidatus Limnocylindrales bacterium]